jgi:hypothetical protein
MVIIPTIIDFPKLGNSSLGYISPAEKDTLPFEVKRIYWTYYTPEDVERGGHSHINLQQILVAVSGIITISTEMPGGIKNTFILDTPSKGLLIPKLCWREMKYTHNAVQMCLASIEYNEKDYIRNYEDFKALKP